MWIQTETMVSISEMNQNIKKVQDVVDRYGSAVIMKNNKPFYIAFEPKWFDVSDMKSIGMREYVNNFSKLAYYIYDAGCVALKKRNKAFLVIYDYKIIANSNLGKVQMIKEENNVKDT